MGENSIEIFATKTKLCMSSQQWEWGLDWCTQSNKMAGVLQCIYTRLSMGGTFS